MRQLFYRIFRFYYDGFKNMTIGKRLWLIIILKLIILFAVFKLFFFKDFLKSKFDTDKERSDYVIDRLTGGE